MKFLDISPESKRGSMEFREQQLDLHGLSARQIARVLTQHESIQSLMDGKQVLNVLAIIELAPKAVTAFIAYGTGYDDSSPEQFDKAMQAAEMLAADEQINLCIAIGDLTFGKHLSPFVDLAKKQFAAWGQTGESEKPAHPPDIRNLSASSRKALKNSLRSVTNPEMFGATPRNKSAVS